eukprot:4262708-Amphidinium_carterae.1
MGRARKLSTEQQSSNASTVQLKKLYKVQLRECEAILRKHEVVRGPVLQYLKDLNYTVDVEAMPRKINVDHQARTQALKTGRDKRAAAP